MEGPRHPPPASIQNEPHRDPDSLKRKRLKASEISAVNVISRLSEATERAMAMKARALRDEGVAKVLSLAHALRSRHKRDRVDAPVG